MNLRMIKIHTENPEQLTKFYSKLFQKEPTHIDEGRLIEFDCNGTLFGIYDPSVDLENSPELTQGTTSVPTFKVENIQSERERISEITEIKRTQQVGDYQWFVIEDPDGNPIKIYSH